MQGGEIAMVTPGDLIKLLQENSKMQQLRQETANAYFQRETCSAELVTQAVAAATNPTAGQAMLQRGNRGLAVGGSRSQESTTVDEAGNVRVDRFSESFAELPNGQGIRIQNVNQSVHVEASLFTAPDAEIEMERGARSDSMALMNSTMARFIKESKQEFEAFKKEYKLQDEAKEEARKLQDEQTKQEAEAREQALKQEFEALKKASEDSKQEAEAKEEARKLQDEQNKQEAEDKQEVHKLQFEAFKKASEDSKKEEEAKEEARKLQFEALKKASEDSKQEAEVKEEARKLQDEQNKQEAEDKEEVHKLQFEALKKVSEDLKKASEDSKQEAEAKEEARKLQDEAKEAAQKKEIVDLKKLVRSSQKRPAGGSAKGAAGGSGKGPSAKKRCRDKTLTFIVCNDGVYSLRMWINGVVVEKGVYTTLEKAQEALHLHVNGSRHIRDMMDK